MEMNLRQKRFADEYIITGKVIQSALAAGYSAQYSKSDACKILERPDIKEYIKERNKELDSEKIATMKEVKEFWTRLMRSPATEHKDALKASELIARTNGAFIDKVEHSGSLDINIAWGNDEDPSQ